MITETFLSMMAKFNEENTKKWVSKNHEYAEVSDVFKNFRNAAKLTVGGDKNYEAAWNFAVKHLVSIQDIIDQQEFFTDEQIDEKFGDFMVYLHMIRAMIIEERRLLSK